MERRASGDSAKGDALKAALDEPGASDAALSALNASLISGQPPALDGLPGVLNVAASAFDTASGLRIVVGAAVMVVTAAATWLLMRERPRAT